MSNDFYLAGEVVKEFISIGNVARAMVLQGMKEYTRQTFGEEALSLFGEDGGFSGSSGVSGGKGGKSKLAIKDYNNLVTVTENKGVWTILKSGNNDWNSNVRLISINLMNFYKN
eukprot:TRINITY_DN6953_c0_g1_i2.p1 TRINITY_DN6953_c0_g1~~TRINITY_DN6953_c0_g1_i2.p1  ORF type:complete len:114 (-),score=32.87 TRINITY_DN6953_c0_g1_i2:37-378(-)